MGRYRREGDRILEWRIERTGIRAAGNMVMPDINTCICVSRCIYEFQIDFELLIYLVRRRPE